MISAPGSKTLRDIKRELLAGLLLKTSSIAETARLAGIRRTHFYRYFTPAEVWFLRAQTNTGLIPVGPIINVSWRRLGRCEDLVNRINREKAGHNQALIKLNPDLARSHTLSVACLERQLEDYLAFKLGKANLTSRKSAS